MRKCYFLLVFLAFSFLIQNVQAESFEFLWLPEQWTYDHTNADVIQEYSGKKFVSKWTNQQQTEALKLYAPTFNVPKGSTRLLLTGLLQFQKAYEMGLECSVVDVSNGATICTYYDGLYQFGISIQAKAFYNNGALGSFCDIKMVDKTGFFKLECPIFSNATTIDQVSFYVYHTSYAVNAKPEMFIGLSRDIMFYKSGDNAINASIQEQTKQQHEDAQKQLEEQKKQTDTMNETKDFVTSDEQPDTDISVLGNVSGIFPPGPVDSLLNIPFTFLSIVNSSLGGVCKPFSGNFVFDTTLTIPCFSELVYDDVPDYLMIFINVIPTAFLLIKYFKHLYKKVDRAVSLETTSDDEWGCV